MKRICFAAEELGFDYILHHRTSLPLRRHRDVRCPLYCSTPTSLPGPKRIKFAPLALVLTTWDPIRAAEELAILDHLTKGRTDGRIRPWLPGPLGRCSGPEVSSQGYPVGQVTATNERNKRLFEENWQVDQGGMDRRGAELTRANSTRSPSPTRTASRGWALDQITRDRGAPGEIDDDGVIRGISVVPKPYQTPHPHAYSWPSPSASPASGSLPGKE